MFRRGRRLFTTASILLLVVACVHGIGNVVAPPSEGAMALAEAQMRKTTQDMGFGMSPSLMDILVSLSWTMSIMLAIWGLTNLAVASADPDGRIIGRLAWLSTIGLGVLVALFAWARIPPPLIFFSVVGLFYLAAAIKNR